MFGFIKAMLSSKQMAKGRSLGESMNYLQPGSPFAQWQIQMMDENVAPLQSQIAFSMIQPPKIGGVNDMFSAAIAQRYWKRTQRTIAPGNPASLFSFVSRITNLLQAARNANGESIWWVPKLSMLQAPVLVNGYGVSEVKQQGYGEPVYQLDPNAAFQQRIDVMEEQVTGEPVPPIEALSTNPYQQQQKQQQNSQ